MSSHTLAMSTVPVLPFDQWQHQRVALANVSIHLRYHGTGPPLLLVHGYPQHSLTWHTIGPILAQHYTVIAPDNRGMGNSAIPSDYKFTAEAAADDLKGILDFLKIDQTYVFSHDKGSGIASALASKYRSTVKRLGVSEYALPGFGYEAASAPTPNWDLYANWQLAFFSIPDAAQFFIQGREKEMLSWYFFHASYSGTAAFSEDHLNRYTSEISKPGFLRSGLSYFENSVVANDSTFFEATVKSKPLTQPVLALGGEASLGPYLKGWNAIGEDVALDIVPKAGHWIADENPLWVAKRVLGFFAEDSGIPAMNLSYLSNQFTLL